MRRITLFPRSANDRPLRYQIQGRLFNSAISAEQPGDESVCSTLRPCTGKIDCKFAARTGSSKSIFRTSGEVSGNFARPQDGPSLVTGAAIEKFTVTALGFSTVSRQSRHCRIARRACKKGCRADSGRQAAIGRDTVVSAQPLNYLQNFGGITDIFLYERSARGGIALKPGVDYCLRRFYTPSAAGT
ncbi:hypothetical protein OKW30_003489 [Paraburkholderia sp. Clong3]|uniref:hypothetical protein n=1 Tax=Paraburkholderia sp. Clong3 TaxID=2991061 RepID=UPI003D208105